MEDKKVNLFVVGAMRAGTTSFMELLSKHPDIYVSPIKEPHFFVDELPEAIFEPQPDNFLDNYFKKKFPKPIHRAHVRTIENYRNLFKNATAQEYLAEGSVSYLHAPDVAAKLKRYNPDAKIIILTRDPLERAFSHYKMDVGLFRENKSFEEVLKKEIKSYYNNELPWYSYLNMSFYKRPIDNFQCCFGDAIFVVAFEKLIYNPKETFQEISSFLEIAPFRCKKFPDKNKNKSLRFKNLKPVIEYLKLYTLTSILPLSCKRLLKRVVLAPDTNLIPVSEELQTSLASFFKKEC